MFANRTHEIEMAMRSRPGLGRTDRVYSALQHQLQPIGRVAIQLTDGR